MSDDKLYLLVIVGIVLFAIYWSKTDRCILCKTKYIKKSKHKSKRKVIQKDNVTIDSLDSNDKKKIDEKTDETINSIDM